MTKMTALLDVSPPIVVEASLAGRKFPITLGEFAGHIVLPEEGEDLRLPSEDRRDWPRFHTETGYPDPLAPRTHASGGVSIPASFSQLNIDALCFELDIDDAHLTERVEPNAIVLTLSGWLATFRSWIGLWTRLPQTEELRRLHPFAVLLGEQDGELMPHYLSGITQTAYLSMILVDETMLTTAAEAASSGQNVPEDRLFLARAQRMIGISDYRASVIDSCTAAEIALSRWIKEDFERQYDSAVASELLQNTQGVANLFKLYFAARGSELTFEQIRVELARPRNRAVHVGATIHLQDAETSLATATRLINELAPIKYP